MRGLSVTLKLVVAVAAGASGAQGLLHRRRRTYGTYDGSGMYDSSHVNTYFSSPWCSFAADNAPSSVESGSGGVALSVSASPVSHTHTESYVTQLDREARARERGGRQLCCCILTLAVLIVGFV